ncbi:hypothetical protein GC169_04015 [bacterium]|nr:hypothetical protein [bacterium]
MYLRLRQIALVAQDLEASAKLIGDVFGAEVCFRDPGVGKYGLHNVLFAFEGTFLEVVAPLREGTAAGRYIERRKGDGGYMFIVDCDDLEARRDHMKAVDVRLVEDLKVDLGFAVSEALHLHPRDTGGCLLSIDRHSGGPDTRAPYGWAGADWRDFDRSERVGAILGAEMQCVSPEETAARWMQILGRDIRAAGPGVWTMPLTKGFAHFVPLADDRGEGLSEVHIRAKDRAAVIRAAEAAGAPHGTDWVEMVGVKFNLRD